MRNILAGFFVAAFLVLTTGTVASADEVVFDHHSVSESGTCGEEVFDHHRDNC